MVLENIKKEIKDFEDKSNSTQETTKSESNSIGQKIYSVNKLKHASLSAYLGSLSTYFALFVVNLTGSDKINLKEHPVMEGILRCKELWNSVKDLKIIGLDDSEDDDLEVSSFDNKSIKSLGDKLDDSDSSEDEGDIFDTDALIKSAVKSSQKKLAAAATKRKRVKSESDSEFEEAGAFADFFDFEDDNEEEEEEEENDDKLEAHGEDYDSDLELEAPITNLSIKNQTVIKET